MTTTQLNLARKWRSKTFDQIVGQDLTVKMLKNSLYLQHYFPVYLFAGQKGCGKTSTARVFAAAINCEQLPQFQKDPKNISVPCLICQSCTAMQAGKHPDFTEIDAASHTGVDNVRQIVDAASLLPLMGNKKIYLIDEAHMLSKAAFNAFLKLLEEPPASVIFMLATTDTQKIIDTVRSRCFQLFFKPVEMTILSSHIQHICQSESIPFEPDGIFCIIRETGGCVRDALNLLEQVRFAHESVSASAVAQVLGHLDDAAIITLYALALSQQPEKLLQYMQQLKLEKFSALYIWTRLTELIRAVMWTHFNVQPLHFLPHYERLQELAQTQWIQVQKSADLVYAQEQQFLKTSAQHSFLEMILLRLACQELSVKQPSVPASNLANKQVGISPLMPIQERVAQKVPTAKPMVYEPTILPSEHHTQLSPDQKPQVSNSPESFPSSWKALLNDVELLGDPLLSSIFMQGNFRTHDVVSGVIEVEFSKELVFFQDWLDNTKKSWQPLVQEHFGSHAALRPLFTGKPLSESELIPSQADSTQKKKVDSLQQPRQSLSEYQAKKIPSEISSSRKGMLDISDIHVWKKTHLLLRYFPGIVCEIQES